MSERDPILPSQSGSRRSRTSFLSNLSSSRRDSKALTIEEVHPNGDDSPAPLAPAAAVPASERTSLHDPRWAEEDSFGVKPNALAVFRHNFREELAEFVGSSLIIFFGAGVQCSVYLHGGTGDYLSCRFAWAVGVAMGIFAAGGVSGAHLNPTVTIALSIFRGFPARKVLSYIIAQVLGCAFAALLIYANYYHSIEIFEGGPSRTVTGPNSTAGLFFTFPQPFLPASSAFLSEFLASALLILIVFSLSDKNNLPPPQGTMPFAMFLALLGIGASLGSNTGYAMNGARDTGPRIALWLVGYGNEVFSNGHLWFAWGPWLAAILGGLFGGLSYDFLIYNGQDSPLNRPVARTSQESAVADEYHD